MNLCGLHRYLMENCCREIHGHTQLPLRHEQDCNPHLWLRHSLQISRRCHRVHRRGYPTVRLQHLVRNAHSSLALLAVGRPGWRSLNQHFQW